MLFAEIDTLFRASLHWSDAGLDFHEMDAGGVERDDIQLQVSAPPVAAKDGMPLIDQKVTCHLLRHTSKFHP